MNLQSKDHAVMVRVDTALPGESLPTISPSAGNSQSVVIIQRNLTYEDLLALQELLKAGNIDALLAAGREKLAAARAPLTAGAVGSMMGSGLAEQQAKAYTRPLT